MTSSARIAGGDIQLSVDRAGATAELEQLRSTVRSTFAGMSDDALKFVSAQDRLDRALKSSNGKITSSVRSAELNLRRVQQEASKSSSAVVSSAGRSTVALRGQERELNRVGRGFIAGSGLARSFGRSLAFASSTFLGSFGFVFALKSATDAAEAQQVAEGQLETALKNRGAVVEQVRGQVNALVAANAQLGFGEHDVTSALTLGVTTTGNLAGATRILTVAQNVARAKGIDLYAATQLVIKGFLGQSRGLKSLGVDLGTGVKGWAALDAVQAKYSGRAVAFADTEAGARARANAELERTKVTIGDELLPIESKLATSVANYLGKAENQAKIQRDVNSVMKTGGELAHDFAAGIKLIEGPVKTVNSLLGGTERTVKLLLLAFAAQKLGLISKALAVVKGGIVGVGTAAVTTTGELNAMATAEGRAAAAGAGAGGVAVPTFGKTGPFSRAGQIPTADLRAAGAGGALGLALGGGLISSILLSGFGSIPDTGGTVKTVGGGEYVGTPPKPGSKIKGPDGRMYRVYYDAQGRLGLVNDADLKAAREAKNATGGDTLNPRSNVPGSPTYVDPNAPATAAARPRPLDRLTKINLAVSAAQLAVSRGDKGADQQLVAALKQQIDYDRDYEQKQEQLLKTDPKNKKEHAANLQRLYGDEQSARDQIQSIEDSAAAKRKTARDKALAAAKKAHQAALDAHRQTLAARLGGIETQITGAQTAEQNAPNTAKLKLAQQRERHATELLLALYTQETHDPLLTKAERAAASKNAAKTRQKLATSVTDDRAAQLKAAVETAQSAVLAASEGTAAYTRAIAAEKKALDAEIAYYKARASNAKLPLSAQRSAVAAELAAEKQRKALDTKAKPTDVGATEREAIATLQQIIQNQSNFSLDPVHATLKQSHTRLFQMENHLANIRASTDSRGLPQATADAAVAHGVSETAFA